MKKKGFKLDQVLKYRKEIENVRKQEFAVARQKLEEASNRLKIEEEKVENLSTEFMDKQQEGISSAELQMYSSFFRRKRADIKNQRNNVVTLDHDLGVKRETLIDASKGKKMLETLEKKSAEEVRKEVADKERGEMEEIALRNRK
jgi:flagellar protein FliJ